MSTDQYDPAQVVRIRMRTGRCDPLSCGERASAGAPCDGSHILERWSRRLLRHEAETAVALGSEWLSVEHARGDPVASAIIRPWTFD